MSSICNDLYKDILLVSIDIDLFRDVSEVIGLGIDLNMQTCVRYCSISITFYLK